MNPAHLPMYFISIAVFIVPLNVMVQFSLPYYKHVKTSVFMKFIIPFFKVYCGLYIVYNYLLHGAESFLRS